MINEEIVKLYVEYINTQLDNMKCDIGEWKMLVDLSLDTKDFSVTKEYHNLILEKITPPDGMERISDYQFVGNNKQLIVNLKIINK